MPCKICSSKAAPLFSFGKMPVANAFLNKEAFAKEYFFELAVGFCEHCKMFQLLHQPDYSQMFHEHYAFYTSTSTEMSKHFERMANNYIDNWLKDKKDPFVIELGSNDGTMLKHIVTKGIRCLGVEPSRNVADVAIKNGIDTKVCFFNDKTALEICNECGKADLISVANVHFAYMNEVAIGIKVLLKEDGVFVFENPYLGNVIENVAYDQIYDEHSYIFSLNSVSYIFEQVGMEIFHIEPQVTHGGSMRYYIGFKGIHEKDQSVIDQFYKENNVLKLGDIETYRQFAKNCEQRKQELLKLLKDLKNQGKRIVGYAATAKSTTVLNYCGIGPNLIDCIYDTTPIKQNKFSPGMHIPVKPYTKDWYKEADCAVLFAWNHAKEIFAKENEFKQNGGQWVLFMPHVHCE